MRSLALDLGGHDRVSDMISGKGVSLILKEITLKFRRPVLYPDTVSHLPNRPRNRILSISFGVAKAIYPWLASYRTQAAQHSPDSLRLCSSDLVIRSAGGRYDVGLYTDLVRLSYTVIRAF